MSAFRILRFYDDDGKVHAIEVTPDPATIDATDTHLYPAKIGLAQAFYDRVRYLDKRYAPGLPDPGARIPTKDLSNLAATFWPSRS